MVADSFFTVIDDRFVGTDHARGPWDPDSCHAGPVTGLLARALERTLPAGRLTRITVDITRTVPMAGFSIEGSITRAGRTVSTTEAVLFDQEGRERIRARGLHIVPSELVDVPTTRDDSLPTVANAKSGPFPIRARLHGLPGLTSAVDVRYPPGQDPEPGPTTIWMRTPPLLPDEASSPFQRMCPLADCGNAIGRNAEPAEIGFMNVDLTIVLHRDPVGEWLGSRAVSRWEPTGIGMADALLFDRHGVVGRAVQTLLLTRQPS